MKASEKGAPITPIITADVLEKLEKHLKAGDKLEMRLIDGKNLAVWVQEKKKIKL